MNPSELEDLDEAVLKALRLFIQNPVNEMNLPDYKRPLVVGSGNAAITARIICRDYDYIAADESTYQQHLHKTDGVILVSASGKKHAPIIAKTAKEKGLPVTLITCNEEADYADQAFVSPKRPEPYTYNTSTYMGMILRKTKEDPNNIKDFIERQVKTHIPKNLDKYNAYFVLIPEEFDNLRGMFKTKFEELFGPKINGRIYTPEQAKHAKTVIPSEKELFISIGYPNETFGNQRLSIPLHHEAGPAMMMAVGYYVIGHIQKQHPPYFKNNIEEYCRKASKMFKQEIKPIA